MTRRVRWIALFAALLPCAPALAQDAPLRVAIRAGPKTHGAGEHDHPRFLADWTELLRERGCEVVGALEFPSAAELESCDVLVLYAAEGAAIHGAERERLEAFLARGGGLVVLHDALCGDDPAWFAGVAGGAWEHGRSKWQEGELGLCFADREHPITRGVANFDFDDEIYWELELSPAAHVLANAFHTPFDVTPQMWTFEPGAHRAFVAVQGHRERTFAHPAWRTLLLRGIARAARRDADLLVRAAEIDGLRYPPGGPLAPEAAAASLRLHPDFEIALVAAEPLVVNPISLDWDARGRLWVALTPGYPGKRESSEVPARDSIAILEDADGDGRMDGKRVFADGLDLVTSFVFHEDGVIAAQAPEILFLRDSEGDDRADERRVLFRGFGTADTHAVISNLRRGLDGWIYGTQGYSGNDSKHVVGRGDQDFGAIGNGVFRFRPDGSAIERVVSCNANTWGLDFSADGELFYTMANGSHLRHVVLPDAAFAGGRVGGAASWVDVTDHDRVFPLRAVERPPYQQNDFAGGFTAAAGACFYTGGTWPAEYDGDHVVCEPTVNLVHQDRLEPDGVTFRARKTREPEFLASTDLWFRPVLARVGPAGALYVLDFYGQAVVHNDTRGPPHGPTNAALRPDRDHEHGRIWRVDHVAARALARDPPAQADERELVGMLEHPNAWFRSNAQRLLTERAPSDGTHQAILRLALNSLEPRARIHALWLLTALEPADATRIIDRRFRDPEPAVRANALRALATLDPWQLARAGAGAALLARDPDPSTSLAALVAVRDVLAQNPADALELLASFDDDWRRSALLAIAARSPARFVEASLAAPEPERFTGLVELLCVEVGRRNDLGAAVEVVRALGAARGRSTPLAETALRALERALDPTLVAWTSTPLETALLKLVSNESTAVATAALPFAERWGRDPRLDQAKAALGRRLGAIAADPAQPVEQRLDALATMLALASERAAAIEIGASLLGPATPLSAQLELIDALARTREPAAARALCDAHARLSRAARERAFERLIERPEWTAELCSALEARTIQPGELGTEAVHRLRNHADPALARRASAVLDAADGGADARDADLLIAELLPEVAEAGDRERGRAVFESNCVSCHTLEGAGFSADSARGGVGPDLTGRGALGARELLTVLLDPNRSVEPAYVEHVVETEDGRLVAGVIARETDEALTLRSSAGEHEVRRDEIVELRSTGRSPMPTGFESLGAAALRDLFSFLGAYGGGPDAPGGAIEDPVPSAVTAPAPAAVLIFGGGSSHDFERWFAGADARTLAALGREVAYSEDPRALARALDGLALLVLCANQPLEDPTLRAALLAGVEHGQGLLLVHAATWFNWADWPAFNRDLAGGGARSHEDYGAFDVRAVVGGHPLLRGVPGSFTITDELYRFEPDPAGAIEVLAIGRSPASGAEFPVVWTKTHGAGRIAAITLGHDGAAHEHPAYRRLLENAARWLVER